MSWLLGQRYSNSNNPQNFSQLVNDLQAPGGGGDGDKNVPPEKRSMEYRFDSSALERAAKAAKDLEKSAHAKEALELLQKQEATRQMELQAEMKKYEASIEQMKSERSRIDAEERRRLLQEETKQHQARAQYQDQLARARYDDQLAQQHKMNEENLRRQEESVAKQEAMKKATIEHQLEMENKNYEKRLEMEMRAKAKMKRENFDLTLQELKLKATEKRETTLESIKLYGAGLSAFLESPEKIIAAVTGLSVLAVGVYAAKGGMGVLARQLEAHLSKPTLVRETSRISLMDLVKHPVISTKKIIEKRNMPPLEKAIKGEIILSPKIQGTMLDVAIATKNTKRNKGTFPNLLMYGPPGTGKTMFSRMLARHSGLDYAIVSGGDFAPLGKDGVTEIHKIFDWADTSRKGLLLFIDEAEAFLRHRNLHGSKNTEGISMDQRMMLSAFLEKTGTPSRKFMLVLASNEPQDFDAALMDRIDMNVHFDLPGIEERKRLVYNYFKKYVLEPAAQGKFTVNKFSDDYTVFCDKVAELTSGFSGRQLEKLAIAWQTATYSSADRVLTEEIFHKTCERAINEHQKKLKILASYSEPKTTRRSPDISDSEHHNKPQQMNIEQTQQMKAVQLPEQRIERLNEGSSRKANSAASTVTLQN